MIEATMPACPENKKSSSRGEHQGSHTAASSSTGPTGRQHPHQPAAAATAAEDDASRSPPPLGGNSLSRDEETLRDDAHCPTSVVGANTEPLSNKVDDDNEEENDGTNRNRDDIPSSNNNTNRADDDDDDDDADYDCENGASYDTIESELLPTTSDTQCNDDDDDEDDENAAAARVSLPAPSSNTNTPPMATSRQRRRLLKQQKRIYSLLDAAPSSDDKMQPPHHQQQHQPQQSCSSLNCDDTGFAAAAARRVPNNTDPQSGATTTLLGMTSLKVESPRTESHADPIQDNMDSKPDRTLDAEPRTPAATATTTTAKGELHRQTTEKKSNVSSPSAYSPGSLLDDDQSNCSERPLRQKISLAANASTSAAAATTGTRMPVLLPPLHSQANNNSSTGNTNIAAPRMRSAESDGIDFEEKKDHVETEQPSDTPERRAQVAQRKMPFDFDDASSIDHDLRDCLSATESEVASLDGLPSGIQQRWLMGESPRETMLQSLDGVHNAINWRSRNQSPTSTSNDAMLQSSPPRVVLGGGNRKGRNDRSKQEVEDGTCDGPLFASCFDFSMWTGGIIGEGGDSSGRPENGANNKGHWRTSSWKQQHDVPLAIMDCANIINQDDRCSQFAAQMDSRVQPSVVQVASDYPSPTYAETILPTEVDPRMQDWIASQYAIRDRPPKDGTYQLGRSRTVIVHEMFRGNWTWCTSWSPDGAYLAIATDNHHLAVVDTASSTVWRVCHDRKIREPPKNNSTNSIRSVAWGPNYIAIGGTGNAVSILSSTEPYNIIHTIPGTGFVGCLHWRCDSDVLAIGSRLDCVMIMRIQGAEDFPDTGEVQRIESYLLHKIPYKYWANSVAFSPDGCFLAVGDSGGIVSVYDYDESDGDAETNMITWFKRKDSILSIEWSPDGKWLYAGGEDRSVTVIDTTYWEIVHRIGQDRWVQCIASSHGGTHVAVGGVSSEISILDVENGWDSVMGIELKGLVPLSAKWHPRDQYLVMTGQDNSILAVETTNARHVKGHHLHSISPIRVIEFSPDGRMAIIGNESGIVTFYSLSDTTFITAYEIVIPLSSKVCVQWSFNGMFVVVGCSSSCIIVWRKRNKRQGKKNPPNASGFSIKKAINDFGPINAVAIESQSNYVAISGNVTRILDVKEDFATVKEWKKGPYYANAWSPDGRWLAMMGREKCLTIYDTSSKSAARWKAIFSMKCDFVGRSLAWGPLLIASGLLYLAYGGESNVIYVMEIRTIEGTWETVLSIPRDASINALDWSIDGLLAAGIGNGTVSIVDLAYLQSGVAVNEMDPSWQRQALTCFTEIRRNRGDNAIKSLRWLPAAPGSDRLLAVGGTDGEVEIVDLTERRRCKGYAR